MFRHLVRHRYPATLTRVRTTAIIFFCLALAGCSDDGQQARINALDEALATANAETASLRASRKVLQTRLDAARIAARTAGARLQELNPKLEQLTSREVHGYTPTPRLRGACAAPSQRSHTSRVNWPQQAGHCNQVNPGTALCQVSWLP